MTTLSVSKAIFTFLFLLLGSVGFTTAGASTVRAGDGPSFQFCYDYNCPKPHFSVLHQRSRKAAHVARDQPVRPHTRLDQTDQMDAGENCCVIIGIDRHRSVVMGHDRTSDRKFQFVVRNRRLLGALRLGQAVSVNFTNMEVLMSPPCGDKPCQIVLIARSSPDLATQE